VNGNPSSAGLQAAMRQIWSRAAGPNLRGRPPLHFGDSAANPESLNAWITSRTYPSVAANITAISPADRPCAEACTIPHPRTRSRADLVILTSRCASSDSNDRANTSGRRATSLTPATSLAITSQWGSKSVHCGLDLRRS
jgi:hypothetical protein